MKLPVEVEPAGILLFKSFSYLGSYPLCTTAGPVPLSFDAFLTAFVVLIGRLDTKETPISENLFFQSLSILPPPDLQEEQDEPVVIESEEAMPAKRESRGLSLAELGIDFNDMDLNKDDDDTEIKDQGSNILCRDLIEIFVFLLWLGQVDKKDAKPNFNQLRKTAEDLVFNIKPLLKGGKDDDDLPCISHSLFCHWKDKFSPHLFKPLQSFVIKAFTYYDTSDSPERLLMEDTVPDVDHSDILDPLYTTLLCWSLPLQTLQSKKWVRLYSADQDGFSMNRFESHVFKYPGPTLFVMRVDSNSTSKVLGAYITQPWKHSKQFWGSADCFLFELDPSFDIYRPILNEKTGESKNDHYILYHHEIGIGFGAMNRQLPALHHQNDMKFILSLHNSLQHGVYQHEAYTPQPSFESATKTRQLLDFCIPFETDNIEVFGLGTAKDRETQAKEWQFEKKEASRRAGLNIRTAEGDLDKELLKMAGIIDEDKRQER